MTTTYDIVRDTFSRIVVDDWGRADNGTDWEIMAGAVADFDVDGTRATITHPTAASTHRIRVPGNFKNVAGFLVLRTSAISTGASTITDILLRWVDDSNYVAARAEFNTSSNAVAVVYKVVGGVVTALQTTTITAYAANQDWAFRFEVKDNTVRAKLWGANGLESPVWDASGSVSDITGAGRLIVQTRRESGNTNAGHTFSYRELEFTSTIPTVEILSQFLNDYEFKFGQDDNAIVLNNGAALALPGEPIWDVQKVSGLDLPDVKVSDKEFDGIDGGVAEAANISMRTVVLEGVLYAHQDDSLEEYLDLLKANYAPAARQTNGEFFDPSQKPFFVKPPGVAERFVFAKSIGLKYDWDASRRFNSTPFQIILKAQVPTLFSPELHMVSAALSGDVAVEHRLQVFNAGNYHTYALIRFFGVSNFPFIYIRHEETNTTLDLSLGFDVGSVLNRPVEINMRQRTVFVVDNPPENHRMEVAEEGWWRLSPGMNTIIVQCDESISGRVELLWRDEWY